MGERLNIGINPNNLRIIKNTGERKVANYFLNLGYQVIYQIPINGSVIDFKVTRICNGFREEILVEVSSDGINKAVGNPRKIKQIESMRSSGLPYRLVCKEEWKNWD